MKAVFFHRRLMRITTWWRWKIFITLVLGSIACVSAAEVPSLRLIVSSDNAFASETADQLQKQLGQTIPPGSMDRIDANAIQAGTQPVRLTVTIGESAWKAFQTSTLHDTAVLAVMPQSIAYEALSKPVSKNRYAIYLEQPLGRWLNLASLIKPDARIGVVLGTNTMSLAQPLQAAAANRKLKLIAQVAYQEIDVGRTLAGMIRDIDILLAIPDANVHNANTVQPILLMSYQAGVPVLGYSPSYQRAGAMVIIHTTPAKLAEQVAETVIAHRDGKTFPTVQTAKYFSVGINTTVARSLGVNLPDVQMLEQRLRTMKE